MPNALTALFFANYYGFDKISRIGGTPRAAYYGELLCTHQITLVALNVVYALALGCPHNGTLPYGVVVVVCMTAMFANYFGVIKSSQYPAFRTRLDRQPFVVKFGMVLFSFASYVVGIPGIIWLMQRYHRLH